MTVSWVEQKHSRGCGFAALAMLTHQGYEAVVADFQGMYDPELASPIWQHMDRYLALHGLAICRIHEAPLFADRPHPWPPVPFGAVHLCNVRLAAHSPCNHFVVMLADGTVLDPIAPALKRLSDYFQVNNVAAIVSLEGVGDA